MKKITTLILLIGMFVLGCSEKTEVRTTCDIKGIVKNTDHSWQMKEAI
jgi:hypothetical protein